MEGNYGDIIFFALVAVYLAFKLNGVLGKKNEGDDNVARGADSERRSTSIKGFGLNDKVATEQELKPIEEKIVKVIDFRDEIDDFEFSSKKVKNGMTEILEKDRSMSLSSVVEGAKYAFDMVLKAFSDADKDTLKGLLSGKVYKDFDKRIDELNKQDLISQKSLISITLQKITGAKLVGNVASVKMKFLSEQINFIQNEEGEIVEGNKKHIETVIDEWEFERNIKSQDPNWQIISV